MSFRLFIYYCALCGGGGALFGWGLGRFVGFKNPVLTQGLKGLFLGLAVALALGLVDALWAFSLRRFISVGLRVATAVAVGTMGGLLGGLVGQALYGVREWGVFLVFGWTITGLLIGVSLGVFDLLSSLMRGQDPGPALRKILKGLLGGTLGGILGGILSLLLLKGWTGLLRLLGSDPDVDLCSPSAWGFVALGSCIGLMIGLAQVILKEAWLRVEAGFRAGREVILSRPEITIGRAEGCDIGLFGDPDIEKLHARIRREGNRYVLIDEHTGSGTYVNDEPVSGSCVLHSGDAIRLGKCVLRFGERQKQPA